MDALFRIKLQIPVVKQNLAPRNRIDFELNEGLEKRLTLITAPAGCGKTTAVAKWVKHLKMPVAWFSVDSLDNNPKRFWSYFIAALEDVIPCLGERFSQCLQTTNNISLDSIVTPLIDEIYQYKNNFVFVLDDYNLIEERLIQESMALFIKYLPENAHMVIISRNQLPFNSVRLQTIGYVKEIKMQDMQFTIEEIADLCKIKGINKTLKEIKDLENITEGWAAGVYLMLDSADKDKTDFLRHIRGLRKDKQRIASYLSEEIIDQLGDLEKNFMIKTSILNALSGPLCDALTGRCDGKKMLNKLANSNAFIIRLDDDGYWYRYHHLLAEFLQKKLEIFSDEEKDMLHQQAGNWYANKGYYTEAIMHYLKGHHYEKAADIMEAKSKEMLKTGAANILLEWLDVLPNDIIEKRDILCLTYAWALIMTNKEKEAIYWVDKVETHLCKLKEQSIDELWKEQLEVEVLAAKGFIELKKQNVINTTQSILKFQETMKHGSIFLMYGINFNIGGASLISGMFGLKGHLHMVENEYLPIYEKIRSLIKVQSGYIPTMMGEILFEKNRMDEAIEMLVKGNKEAENSGAIGCMVPFTITYAKVLKSRGDIKGAFAVVRDGIEKLKIMGNIHLIPILFAFETRLRIETGEMDAVESWTNRNCLDIYDNPNINNIFEYFTFARVLMAKKSYDSCLLVLNKIKIFAENENNLLYTLEVLILLAIVYYLQGQTQMAMHDLKHALIIGEENGYERIFIEEGFHMAALLERFIRSSFKNVPNEKTTEILSISPVYVRRLLKLTRDYCITVKVFGTEKTMCKIKTNKNVSLTKREKDIMQLLDSELTNAEIAYTLDISINTVKVNCSNIYRKLEVKNREQAVRTARELKIFN